MLDRSHPPGFSAIGIFFFVGALISSFAAATLLWRGTVLDRVWALNPSAYKQLMPLASLAGFLFLSLAVALTATGVGWFRRRLWGWRLAIAMIATQVVGDMLNCARGDWLGGGVGVIIAGTLLAFLFRPGIRAAFS